MEQPDGIRKYRDFYEMKPGAGFVQKEFGYYCLENWYAQGLPRDANLKEFFGYDEPGRADLYGLGGCEAAFVPEFETKVLRTDGPHEYVQDFAGRTLKCFTGRRRGFMPEYVDHPVKDERTFHELCAWRMQPDTPERLADMDAYLPDFVKKQQQGMFIGQLVVGGYMYLRALIGPADLPLMFYDDPDLIHLCMQAWFNLADHVTAYHQRQVKVDELFISEDICYNHGSLISPNMIREFLFPYYQQLIANMRRRQPGHTLHIQVDTDGRAMDVIDLYREIGMRFLSPCEVASGCDVMALGQQYPDMRFSGGVDKRVLAQGKDAIDRMVDRIFPAMQRRGGYLPTCDHGVPEEVSLENYLHYRKRCREFA